MLLNLFLPCFGLYYKQLFIQDSKNLKQETAAAEFNVVGYYQTAGKVIVLCGSVLNADFGNYIKRPKGGNEIYAS